MNRRDFLQSSAAGIGLALAHPELQAESTAGELLYNGIRLPSPFPPRNINPMPELPTPSYLKAPPAVIPIDVGRQLFVDDFLVETSNLKRTYHLPDYHPANPVLKPDKPWEKLGREGPRAMVFSDGVWYDPSDKLFKMWYMGVYQRGTCYAVSEDGIHWKKPELDVHAGTNIVQEKTRDSTTIWLDLEEKDPDRRFKMFRSCNENKKYALSVHFSKDGIHWSDTAFRGGHSGDRTTVFYNPFRKQWVYSLRNHGGGRMRRYWERPEVSLEKLWDQADEPPYWVGADRLDPQRPDLKTPCQLYNLDCVGYESLLLGLFTIWRGQARDRQKPNEVCVGYSRDGWSWSRPDRRGFCPISDKLGDWNACNVQSAGGCCLVVGDKLYFYVSGRTGVPGKRETGTCSTGLAILRRDGFASLDAGDTEAVLTTRPIRFTGKFLFVNAAADKGELRVEVLDTQGRVLPHFSRDICVPVNVDKTKQAVTWKGAADLSAVSNEEVKLRFFVRNGSLYSFWVSLERSGESHGYVGAGGPGFAGMMDTTGT